MKISKKKSVLISLMPLSLLSMSAASSAESIVEYLQKHSVKNTPVQIGLNVISTDKIEFNTTFTPDEKTMLYSISTPTWAQSRIMRSDIKDGQFTQPTELSINGHVLNAADPHINWQGDKLYFLSSLSATFEQKANMNIWVADLDGLKAHNPRPLPISINTALPQGYPMTNKKGELYYANYVDKRGFDLYKSTDMKAAKPLKGINTEKLESDFYVAPDDSFAIFVGMNWPQGYGVSDLYIVFYKNGQWSKPQNLGATINSPGVDGSPYLTRNRQYLIFTSNRHSDNVEAFDGKLDIYAVKFDLAFYSNKASWDD